MDPERVDKPVRSQGIAQPQSSQLETEKDNTTAQSMVGGNLTNLIEEAKRRADARRRKGLDLRRKIGLAAYQKVESFEEMLMEKGVKLDESS